jgi:CRISPR-associated protein Cas1
MKKLLNTLFVSTQGVYLAKKGETVLVRRKRETLIRVPIHNLQGIIGFGRVSISPYLMEMCARKKVGISFLTERGRFLARVQGAVSGNVLLRRAQYRFAEDGVVSSEIARAIIVGKVANQRHVLMRALRDHLEIPGRDVLTGAVEHMGTLLGQLKTPNSLDVLRGIEGMAGRTYFQAFDHLILVDKEFFFLKERNRRPPRDRMNAMLSFIYTLLAHDVTSALEAVGLDPAVGFLHRDRPGRPSLALDLMEELRPIFADRLALSLVNRRQILGKGFKMTESGAVLMNEESRKAILMGYQQRKQEELFHPFLEEKCAWGILPFIQALLLARYVRGDLDGYPVFLGK